MVYLKCIYISDHFNYMKPYNWKSVLCLSVYVQTEDPCAFSDLNIENSVKNNLDRKHNRVIEVM